MEKIAYKNLGSWIGDAFNDFTSGFTNLMPYGFIYLGVLVLSIILSYCGGFIGALGGQVTLVVAQIVMTVVQYLLAGIGLTMLTGVAVGRAHGRDATMADARLDTGVYVQGVLGYFAVSVLTGLVLAVAAIPGVVPLVIGITNNNNGLIVVGGVLIFILALPVLIVVLALLEFIFPLIVDRRLDFWSAITTSADCVRRDLLGMSLFIIVKGLLGIPIGLIACLTCGIGAGLMMPFLSILTLRAYRDYFGLDADRNAPTPPTGGFAGPLVSPFPVQPAQALQVPPAQPSGFGFVPPGEGQDPRLPPPPPPA